MLKKDVNILRSLIKEFVKEYSAKAGSHPEESYDKELLDDPAYSADSIYVPNDIKKKISKWAKDMGLSTKK